MMSVVLGSANARVGFPAAIEGLRAGRSAMDAAVAAVKCIEDNRDDRGVTAQLTGMALPERSPGGAKVLLEHDRRSAKNRDWERLKNRGFYSSNQSSVRHVSWPIR